MKKIIAFVVASFLLAGCSTPSISSGDVSSNPTSSNKASKTYAPISYNSEEAEEDILCAHQFNKIADGIDHDVMECEYCGAKCFSKPFSTDEEYVTLGKNESRSWTFTLENPITADIWFKAAIGGGDLNNSFFSDSNLVDPSIEEDKFESNPENNGIQRVNIYVNGKDTPITNKGYRELAIYSGSCWFAISSKIKFEAGENTIELKTHDKLRYHAIHSEDVRLVYFDK